MVLASRVGRQPDQLASLGRGGHACDSLGRSEERRSVVVVVVPGKERKGRSERGEETDVIAIVMRERLDQQAGRNSRRLGICTRSRVAKKVSDEERESPVRIRKVPASVGAQAVSD